MAISKELLLAILAMDAYNRGYDAGIDGLASTGGTVVGSATINAVALPANAEAAGFYAISYTISGTSTDLDGKTVISYRGTDKNIPTLRGSGSDLFNGYGLALGGYSANQVRLAAEFYQSVRGKASAESIITTGHSLGGGLAGFVGGLYGSRGLLFDNMPFELGLTNFQFDAEIGANAAGRAPFSSIDVKPAVDLTPGRVSAYHVSYEFLAALRLAQVTPSTAIDSHGGILRDPVNELHSMALLTVLMFARDEAQAGRMSADWAEIAPELWNAFFSEDLAKKVGFGARNDGGLKEAAGKMGSAIAYSAIDDGTRVFGDTGIRAMFDDANQLGTLLRSGRASQALKDALPGLAEAIIQFAGQMAKQKVEYGRNEAWRPELGMLQLYANGGVTYDGAAAETLALDLSKGLWNLSNDPTAPGDPNRAVNIEGLRSIIETFFSHQPGGAAAWAPQKSEMIDALEALYGASDPNNAMSVFNRVEFALGDGPLDLTLGSRTETPALASYDGASTSLFVATDGDDRIIGNFDNNVIVGGKGKDKLFGGFGKDILLGGEGSDVFTDTLFAGSGARSGIADGDNDIYIGGSTDKTGLQWFFDWLAGRAPEFNSIVYSVQADPDDAGSLQELGVEIIDLEIGTLGDATSVEVTIKDRNSGGLSTDTLVNIQKVTLSERADTISVTDDMLSAPIWIDMGGAGGESFGSSDYDKLSFASLSKGIVLVNGASQNDPTNGPASEASSLRALLALMLDMPPSAAAVLGAFQSNNPLRVTGAEDITLTSKDDVLWHSEFGRVGSLLTGWPEGADHPKFGDIDAGAGHDIVYINNPEYVFAGDAVGSPTAPGQPDNRPVASHDHRLTVNGGAGEDRLIVRGGKGAVLVGGEGKDLLFNTSYKGQLWGDSRDGNGGRDTDMFWYSPGTFIMDAGEEDILSVFGVPLTGGTNALSGIFTGSMDWAFDWRFPFMFSYGFTDSKQLLVFNHLHLIMNGFDLSSEDALLYSAMVVEDYTFGGAPTGPYGWGNELQKGDLNFKFKIVDPDKRSSQEGFLPFEILKHMVAYLTNMAEAFRQSSKLIQWNVADDPLVLDLDGDGLETTSQAQSTVRFDIDGDGFAERTAWVDADDGILVLDRDGNGRIDDISEMFGSVVGSGFADLRTLDQNADGRITAADQDFLTLRVWRDLDQDGVSDAGELFTLSSLGITGIDAVGQSLNVTTPTGVLLRERGQFTRADGSTGNVFEAIFETDRIDTVLNGDAGIARWASADAGGRPINSKGYGKRTDLAVEMSNDVTLNRLVGSAAEAMTIADLPTLRRQVAPVLDHWGTLDATTRELAPLRIQTGANGTRVLERAIYVEDANGGYFRLESGGPLRDAGGAIIARPQLTDFFRRAPETDGSQWQIEQQFSPADRATAPAFRADAPYLVRVVDGRPVIEDFAIAVSDASGSYWRLASGRAVIHPETGVIARPSLADLRAHAMPQGQEWRWEEIGHDPHANLPFDRVAVYLVDGTVTQYSVYVTDAQGGFYVWSENLDRALEQQHNEGHISAFNLRNYAIDLDALPEARAADGSHLRVEMMTVGQFRYASALGGIEFRPDVLRAVMNTGSGLLEYKTGAGTGELPANADGTYRSLPDTMLDLIGGFMDQYIHMSRAVAVRLAAQGGLGAFFTGIRYDAAGDVFTPTGGRELVPMFEAIFEQAPESEEAARAYLRQWIDVLNIVFVDYLPREENKLSAESLFQMIVGAYENAEAGGDAPALSLQGIAALFGIDENRIIASEVGEPNLTGTTQSDIFYLGSGNQWVEGGLGADIYVMGRNFGQDTIRDVEPFLSTRSADELRFSHVTSREVRAERVGLDLVIRVIGTDDVVTIKDQFDGRRFDLFGRDFSNDTDMARIIFADGVVWNAFDIARAVSHPLDTNDLVQGSNATDILEGGRGNDVMRGGRDSDIYIFKLGDGQDVIDDENDDYFGENANAFDVLAFGDGITADNLVLTRAGLSNDLLIQLVDNTGAFTGDSIEIRNQFATINTWVLGVIRIDQIERLVFTDNLFLTEEDIMRQVVENARTVGNDTIYGFHFADRIDGGAGDDFLSGGDQGDTYVFGRQSGRDTIEDNQIDFFAASYDVLEFQDGLRPEDFDFLREGASQTIRMVLKSGEGELTLRNQFQLTSTIVFGDHYYDSIDEFRFGDGTIWDLDAFGRHLLAQTRTDGNDTIHGFDKADTLDGGLGNDRLEGGIYNDTYVFQRGYGHDVVFDASREMFLTAGYDTLEMRGIAFADVIIERAGNDLTFRLRDTGESIRLEGQFVRDGNQQHAVERFVFADQTVHFTDLNPEDIALVGTNAGETLVGTDFAEVIDGRAGNDILIGGGDGDTYRFDAGYGQDVIVDRLASAEWNGDDTVLFGADITTTNAIFTKDGNDLLITIGGFTDSLRIQEQFGSTRMGVEWFRFADGTRWHITDIEERLAISGGGRGDDVIVASDTSPGILDGRQGDDQLTGGIRGDTYVFDGGYGIDTITEQRNYATDGTPDRVVLGELIQPDNLVVRRAGTDIILSVARSADQLRIIDGLGDRQVERFEFADGTIWTMAEIESALLTSTAGDDILVGFDTKDDTLDGGTGADRLEGGLGNDTYRFGSGSGADAVLDSGGNADTIQFGPGIAPSMLKFQADGDNLVIRLAGHRDSLVILDTLGSTDSDRRIENFRFDDGATLTFDAIRQQLIEAQVSASDDIVTGFDDQQDILTGAGGFDQLTGLAGNDIYEYRAGDGYDIIDDRGFSGGDVLRILDYSFSAAEFRRLHPDEFDLVIDFPDTNDQIIIRGGLEESNRSAIEQVIFRDGASLTIANLRALVLENATTDGSDVIMGFASDDTLAGGLGADRLDGGSGSDAYLFNRFDGQDVIDESDYSASATDILRIRGYASGDVRVVRPFADRDDLMLYFEGTDDSILLKGQVATGAGRGIERIEFGNGTVWLRAELIAKLTEGGGEAGETISGSSGANTLIGRGGDDHLLGGAGSDTYVFSRGDGRDILDEGNNAYSQTDRLRLHGYRPEDLILRRNGEELIISFAQSTDEIRIPAGVRGYTNENTTGIEEIIFDNGTVWDRATLKARLLAQAATAGNNTIEAFDTDDTLAGGQGDDLLRGGNGSDTYLFNRGDGRKQIEESLNLGDVDTLSISGYAPEDIRFERVGSDLILRFNGTSDEIFIPETLRGEDGFAGWGIERITFANGVTWSRADLVARVLAEASTSGNDILEGFGFGDRLEGGLGNDVLIGSIGADVYVFNRGDGQDRISDTDYLRRNDTLEIHGYLPSELRLSNHESGLVIRFAGTSDEIVITAALEDDDFAIESIRFDNGTEWTTTDLLNGLYAALQTTGNDVIEGTGGADTLAGGTGNDVLDGGYGSDIYVFNRGDGRDLIQENENAYFSSNDVLLINGYLPSEAVFRRDGNTLIIRFPGSGDEIRVEDALSSSRYSIEQITFENGTSYTINDILGLIPADGVTPFDGTSGADTITSAATDDVMRGYAGNDTYIFARGGGSDVIAELGSGTDQVLVQGYLPAEVQVLRMQDDIVLTFAGTTDSLTLRDVLTGSSSDVIEELRFDDGTVWSAQALRERALQAAASTGNDHVLGIDAFADVLAGGPGDDTLSGLDGSDTYIFRRGDGRDRIFDNGSGTDRVVIEGYLPSEVTLFRDGATLHLGFTGTSDRLMLQDALNSYDSEIEEIAFDDGTVWTLAELRQRLLVGTSGNDRLEGFDVANVLDGGVGNDTLIGGGREDTFIFSRGSGHDRIVNNSSFFDFYVDRLEIRGYTPTDVTIAVRGTDLVFHFPEPGDSVTFVGGLNSSGNLTIDQIAFDDGTIWDSNTVRTRFLDAIQTNGADQVTGFNNLGDTLDGGAGNDQLSGLGGNDTYIYARGGGHDRILEDGSGTDRIEIRGYGPNEVTLRRLGDDLILHFSDGADTLTIARGLEGHVLYTVESIAFENGTIWTIADVNRMLIEQAQTSRDDNLVGSAAADILAGGRGDDVISGLAGGDTYRFARGDGRDIIEDNGSASGTDLLEISGYALADALFTRPDPSTNDLVIRFRNSTDSITLVNGVVANTADDIEQIRFVADNLTLSIAEVRQRLETGFSTDGADIVLGSDGDDQLSGGAGADVLDGRGGSDTYIYRAGDGDDRVIDTGYTGVDRLRVVGYASTDVISIRRSPPNGVDLLLTFRAVGDRVVLGSALSEDVAGIETVEFSDGTVWTLADLQRLVIEGSGTAASERIWGFDGADTLAGGTGDDWLSGSAGGDTYLYARGDGRDTIEDNGTASGTDLLRIQGYTSSQASVQRFYQGDDGIVISFAGSATDEIIILNTLGGSESDTIEQIEFADGVRWSMADVLNLLDNHAPVAREDGVFNVVRGQPVTIDAAALLRNDSDADGDALSIIAVSDPSHGTVRLNTDGTVTFTADAGYTGSAGFNYTLSDGRNGSSTGSIVLRVRPPASATDDRGLSVVEDSYLTIRSRALLSNDFDGDLMSISQVLDATNGTVTLSSNGDIIFTPTENYAGPASFRYVANTPDGGRAEATVFIEVTPVNDAPVARGDSGFTLNEGDRLFISVSDLLANDTDTDLDPLAITQVTGNANLAVTLGPDGLIELVPASFYFGTTAFTYVVSDGHGGTATGTATIEVLPVGNAPETGIDTVSITEDVPALIETAALLANDIERDGELMTITSVTGNANLAVTLLENGTIRLDPAANFHGVTSFSYEVSDGHGMSAIGLVDVNVAAVNDAPVPETDAFDLEGFDFLRGREDTPLLINPTALLANDRDADGDALTLASVSFPTNGAVEITPEGMIRFTPNADFWGEAEFHYIVQDGSGAVSDGLVKLYIDPVGDAPPVAADDTLFAYEDVTLTLPASALLGNDTDIDRDPLRILSVSIDPFFGTAGVNPDGSFWFRAREDYNGSAFLTYVVTDDADGTATARANITIEAVNDAPHAAPDIASTSLGLPLVLRISDLLANDSDVDVLPRDYANELRFVSVGPANTGTVSIYQNEFVVVETAADYAGAIALQYTVTDSQNAMSQGSITGSVTATPAAMISGSTARDLLFGTAQADRIEAGTGADDIFARAGDDVIDGGDGADRIDGGEGIDTVTYTASDAGIRADLQSRIGQGGHAQGDVFFDIEALEGSRFADDLFGNGGDNRLAGLDGNDLLSGRAGDDFLEGGAGDDILEGGLGADQIVGGSGFDLSDYSGSIEGVSVSLLSGVGSGGEAAGDQLTGIEGLIGSQSDDMFEGDGETNLLIGGRGNDVLIGLGGDDRLVGGRGADQLIGGEGQDTADYSASAEGVRVDLSGLTAGGGDAAGDSFSSIEIVHGSFHIDELIGDAGDNILRGNAGADTLSGGLGFDTADYANAAEGVSVDLGSGLGTGGDAAGDQLSGIEALRGSSFDDNLTGDAGDNLLDGGAGRDTLAGGAGSDSYRFGFDSSDDLVLESGAAPDTDRILLGTGVRLGDVGIVRQGNDLLVELENDDGFLIDTLTVRDHFLDRESGIEEIIFADGTLWDRADIEFLSRNDRFNAVDDVIRWADEDVPYVIAATRLTDNDAATPDPELRIVTVSNALNGSVNLEADGSVRFTGASNFHGIAGFDYTVTDGRGRFSTAHAEVTIRPVNDAPFAGNDGTFGGTEDTPLLIPFASLFANDGDIDGDTIRVVSVSPLMGEDGQPLYPDLTGTGTNGMAIGTGSGILFTPASNHFGFAGFTYTIEDAAGLTASARVELHFTGVNDAPEARADQKTTRMGDVLLIPVAELIGNDFDPEGDDFSLTSVGSAMHGTVSLEYVERDGASVLMAIFTPEADYLGEAGFTYTLTDGHGASSTGQVSVTVRPQNDPPRAFDDSGFEIQSGQVLVIDPTTLLANDIDPNGDVLRIDRLDLGPAHGDVAFLPDGRIAFTPAANYNGEASFQYWITDDRGGTSSATVNLFIRPGNNRPFATDDVLAGIEDQPVLLTAFSLFGNDGDPDGDVLSFGQIELLGVLSDSFVDRTALAHIVSGTDLPASDLASVTATLADGRPLPAWLSFDAQTRTFSGTPPENYVGRLDLVVSATEPGEMVPLTHAFELVVDPLIILPNGNIQTDYAARAPIAMDVLADVPAGARFTVSMADGTNLPDWLTFDTATRRLSGVAPDRFFGTLELVITATFTDAVTGETLTRTANPALLLDSLPAPTDGVTLAADGENYRLLAPEDFNGSVALRYRTVDSKGLPSLEWGIVVVNIGPERDLPDAMADTFTTQEDRAQSFRISDLLSNDRDLDNDRLSLVSVGDAQHGTVELVGTPLMQDMPPEASAGLPGGPATFSATLANGQPLPGWLSLDPATGRLSGLPPLDASANLALSVTATAGGETRTTAQSLTIDIDAVYRIVFTPDPEFSGQAGFSYTINDGREGNASAAVTVNVTPVNDPPTARTDSFTTREDAPLTFDIATLLANDSDVDGDAIRFVSAGHPLHGRIERVGDQLVYTPDRNFTGTDRLTYTITDDVDGPAEGSIEIAVTTDNAAPVVGIDRFEGFEDQPVIVRVEDLLANDSDPDGDTLTFVGVETNVPNGRAFVMPDGRISFSADGEFSGEVRFAYQISDGRLTTPTREELDGANADSYRSVIINFAPVNDAPDARDDSGFTVVEDGTLDIPIENLLANDTDRDGDAITLVRVNNPINGTVLLEKGVVRFVPRLDYFGNAGFDYTIVDSHGVESTARARIDVVPVNDAPVAQNDGPLVVRSGSSLTIAVTSLLSNDSDPDLDTLVVSGVNGAVRGSVSLSADRQTIRFTPSAGYVGPASFRYTIADGLGGLASAEVTLLVQPNSIVGSEGTDVLNGTTNGDEIFGLGGADELNGNAGNDTLDGGTGADQMAGGTGDDTYIVDNAGDTVTEAIGAGTDTVRTTLSQYTLRTNVENLVSIGAYGFEGTGNALNNHITGGSNDDVLRGEAGNDTFEGGDGHDWLDGGIGSDTMRGGFGNDYYIVDSTGDVIVEDADSGFDTVQTTLTSYRLGTNVENLAYVSTGNFLGFGNALDNTLTGGIGNDTLNGEAGDDRLFGLMGNDTYIVTDAGDQVWEFTDEGIDTVRTTLISYVLGNNVENLVYTGSSAFNGTGNALANRLTGGAGADTLDGGEGADILVGGGGDDIYIVDDAADLVSEGSNAGTDTVRTALAAYTLTGHVENLVYTGSSGFIGLGNTLGNRMTGGSGADQLSGGSGNDHLEGGEGNDILDGGTGVDTLVGGLGDDTYTVDNLADVVVEAESEGIDTVRTAFASHILAAHVENLTYTGTSSFTGTGNALANTIIGGRGSDVLNGGQGADILQGQLGNDTYWVDDAGDQVIELAGEGTDTIRTTLAAYVLGDTIENLVAEGTPDFTGTGNALNNVLTGNTGDDELSGLLGNDILNGRDGNDRLLGGEGNDTLDGGTGDDQLLGGLGNDTYIVDSLGDDVIELVGEGTDTVRTMLGTYTLTANVENLVSLSTSAFEGIGNALNNAITGNIGDDRLVGGAGNDSLNGKAGNDTLEGGEGNDTLNGDLGDDQLVGGTGHDTYIVDSVGDIVTELAGEGTDTIRTTLGTYTLGENLENLVALSASDFTGIGNALNNALTGNIGADRLEGGAGNDTLNGGLGDDILIGGTGNDTYVVDSLGDIVTELVGEGSDTIRTTLGTYTLGENVENLVAASAASLAGTGNSLANSLTGNAGDDILLGLAGNDRLSGGAGNDQLEGGEGSDTLTGGAGFDRFIYNDVGFGRDTVTDFELGIDQLEFSQGVFASWQEVLNATTQVGSDTVIMVNANDRITLKNVAVSALDADSIRFVP